MEVSHLFTYGLLMDESVWRSVVGEIRGRRTACLYGYERVCVPDAPYPGIRRAAPDSVVRGVVWSDMDMRLLARTDAFEDEGEEYFRTTETVYDEEGVGVVAWVYVYARPEALSDVPWSPPGFRSCATFTIE